MKLTIWQQFSSNHSASFSVVGKFENVDKAEEAAKIVRDVIQRIGDDYRRNYANEDAFFEMLNSAKTYQLSSVEQAIKDQYELAEWVAPLDWTYNDRPTEVVKRFREFIFVGNQSDTWTGHPPFDNLLEKLGAEVSVSMEMWKGVFITISCQALDEDTAKSIETSLVETEASIYNPSYRHHYIRIPETTLRFESEFERIDMQLFFREIGLSVNTNHPEYDTSTFFSYLIPYLESKGCSNFVYTIEERE